MKDENKTKKQLIHELVEMHQRIAELETSETERERAAELSEINESLKEKVEREAEQFARRQKMAKAGGQLLGAAFAFIGEMFPEKEETEKTIQMAKTFKERLSECLEKGESGELKMTITLPDETVLDTLAESLARMVNTG